MWYGSRRRVARVGHVTSKGGNTMATCGCGNPIAAEDLFCTACGKPAAASPRAIPACPQCGRQAAEEAAFCSGCGAAMAAVSATQNAVPQGFQWKWALLTIPIVVGVTFVVMLATVIWANVAGIDLDDESTKMILGGVTLVGGMLLGGMLAGWLSPSRTIVEPGAGIAAALTMFQLVLGNTAGIFGGWVLPFLIGAAGAWIGEQLPKRSSTGPR